MENETKLNPQELQIKGLIDRYLVSRNTSNNGNNINNNHNKDNTRDESSGLEVVWREDSDGIEVDEEGGFDDELGERRWRQTTSI